MPQIFLAPLASPNTKTNGVIQANQPLSKPTSPIIRFTFKSLDQKPSEPSLNSITSLLPTANHLDASKVVSSNSVPLVANASLSSLHESQTQSISPIAQSRGQDLPSLPTPSLQRPRVIDYNHPATAVPDSAPGVMDTISDLSALSRATSPLSDVPNSPPTFIRCIRPGSAELQALNSMDLPGMPSLDDTFKSRADFEQACKTAIKDAPFGFRVWSSRDEATAKREGLQAFVELGCTHKEPRICSSLHFRLRASKRSDSRWVVIKHSLHHDEDGFPPKPAYKKRLPSRAADSPLPIKLEPSLDIVPSTSTSTFRNSPRRIKRRKLSVASDEPDAPISSATPSVKRVRSKITVYCYCNYASYGTMMKCCDPACHRQWFHLGCVGYSEAPESDWRCFDCEMAQDATRLAPIPRLADKCVRMPLPELGRRAVESVDECPWAPMSSFLDSLAPTLGAATAKALYAKGLTAPDRFRQLELPQWHEFALQSLKPVLSPFDYFTLDKTVQAFIRDGRTSINVVV